MRFLCLLYGARDAGPAPGSAEFMEMLEQFRTATAAMDEAGVLVDSAPVGPPQSATTVRVRDGETRVTSGPPTDSDEQVGGYYILECDDADAAARWVATLPAAAYGAVEIRPFMSIGGH